MNTNAPIRLQLAMLAVFCLAVQGCLPTSPPAADGTTSPDNSTAAPATAAAPAAIADPNAPDPGHYLLNPVERPVSPELQPEKEALLELIERGLVRNYFPPPVTSPGIFHTETHRVTDQEMELIGVFSSLEQIFLDNSQVTDAGLSHLADKKKLDRLSLSGTQITDAGLAHLRGLPNIVELRLDGVPITDASLEVIAGFQLLKSLDLSRTKVTDAGLDRLSGLRSLKDLSLYGAGGVTEQGVARLQEALPEMKIHGGPERDAQ